ncbi:MAG: hypothetical protein IT269_11485 [Saprospiraceae bacterium]|nr:hypothetical protein [Saprospiraceae bacterium]
MLAILSIIIGLVFVLLLFSMLTSAIVEVYHAVRASRGNHLKETLEMMLGPGKAEKFLNHVYFKQLSAATKPTSSEKLPVWIDKKTFSSILADILTPEGKTISIQERIDLIENEQLRKVLNFLWRQSGDDVRVFQAKVEHWFDEVMARASEWFIDSTKWRLFFFGTALAVAMNADTVQIYQSLSANANLRDEVVKAAELFVQSGDTSLVRGNTTGQPLDTASAKSTFKKIRVMYDQTVASPLGLGWGQNTPINGYEWLTKVIGWLLTGVAVTLGAPFWLDMLKKLISIKGGASGGGDGGSQSNAAKRDANPPDESVFDIKPSTQDGRTGANESFG